MISEFAASTAVGYPLNKGLVARIWLQGTIEAGVVTYSGTYRSILSSLLGIYSI